MKKMEEDAGSFGGLSSIAVCRQARAGCWRLLLWAASAARAAGSGDGMERHGVRPA